jgi:hypothetical protein
MLDAWWRFEWRFWKEVVPRDIHRWMAYLMAGALHYVKGPDISQHWTWGMTPFPVGFPFLSQYLEGLVMLLGPKSLMNWMMAWDDRRTDEKMRELIDFECRQEEPWHRD